MRIVSLRTPIFVSTAMLALMTAGAAAAAGHGGGGGGAFHGGGFRGGFHGNVGHRALALPSRGQWVGNNGFGGPGYPWSPGHRFGYGSHGFRYGQHARCCGNRHFGYNPYREGYGVGYLGGGGYDVGYYGGNGVFYVENFNAYTDDAYRPTAYTAASGYAPIYGDPTYFDMSSDQTYVSRARAPVAYVLEPAKPLPHIINLPTATENPHIIR